MCLIASNKATEKAKATRNPEEFIVRYKVVLLKDGKVLSPYFDHEWQIGVNAARRVLAIANIYGEYTTIEDSIHVCQNYDYAVFVLRNFQGIKIDGEMINGDFVANNKLFCITKVYCQTKDLVGADNYDEEEAYSKVVLQEEDYRLLIEGVCPKYSHENLQTVDGK